MNMDDALQTFIAESREMLGDMEAALLGVQQQDDPSGSVNAIFRAAHTIKGSAGLFGLDYIVEFAHVVESVLDRVREGEVRIDDAVVTLLLACGDHIGSLIEATAAGQTQADAGMVERAAPLLQRLKCHLDDEPAQDPAAAPAPASETNRVAGRAGRWHLSLRFGPDVLRNGMDPISFLRYLNRLGRITGIATLDDRLPALADLNPESCHLGFEIALETAADRAAIEGAFEFVADDCMVRILPPESSLADYTDLIRSFGGEPRCWAEVLVRVGSLPQDGLAQVVAALDPPAAPATVDATPAPQEHVKERRSQERRSQENQSIRVDADKLDRLIDLVGELITASAAATLAGRGVQSATLQEAHSTLAGLVQELRDGALQLRMVKIGSTFNRFQRVVHDISREIGKDIELAISGEDTELDKTVIEKIADPLTHLVRNALDHGIEAAELRVARGKPARGTLSLNAYHDSGSIVIEVGDDGGGLDRDRILAKAIERGLVEPGRNLTDREIYGLIFAPGFSTAEQVTNLSGRGVGMDVVKRNITALRGNVEIASRPGHGTTVTVRLPLTLAIIDGFQVAVGKSVFVVPLEMIDECVAFTTQPVGDCVDLRGDVLPFIRLRSALGVPGHAPARENIVVVRHGGQKFGLVVDRLLGEAQTVIKPLAKMFAGVRAISGSSILGSGDVALILDVPALIEEAKRGAASGALIDEAA